MDPLSMTASIIATIQLASTVAGYLNTIHGATDDQARLTIEATSALTLLTAMRYRVESVAPSDPWFAHVRVLGIENGLIDQFKNALERIRSKIEPGRGIEKAMKTLMWPLKRAEVAEILLLIERLKTSINLALSNDTFRLVQFIQQGQIEITEAVSNMTQSVDKLHFKANEAERQAILGWLSDIDYGSMHTNISNRRQKETGAWLLRHPSFEAWIIEGEKTLWCLGIPGAGKTFLASLVIDHLRSTFASENVAVIYTYIKYKEQRENNASDIVASLLQQLAVALSSITKEIRSLFDEYQRTKLRPSPGNLNKALAIEVERFQRVFIVVDALDECPVEDRIYVLKIIQSLPTNVKILVTSRYLTSIETAMQNSKTIDVYASDDDICTYVESRVSQESRLQSHVLAEPQLKIEIVQAITRSVRGMFLLAKLHMDSLSTKPNRKKVKEALKKLPLSIHDTYDQAMERIMRQVEDDRLLACKTLGWIIKARRSLTLLELQHALAIEQDMIDTDEDALTGSEIIISVCGGLVAVEEESTVVRLVHYSAQEYFITRVELFPNAEREVLETCLTYLSFNAFADGYCQDEKQTYSRLEQFPFLRYASHYWGMHALCLEDQEIVVSRIIRFLDQPGHLASAMQVLLLSSYERDSFERAACKDIAPLSAAACFNLVSIAQRLIANGAAIRQKSARGDTALHFASARDHDTMVRYLVENEADVNAQNRDGSTALHLACGNNCLRVARYLLKSDAKTEIPTTKYNGYSDRTKGMALHWAALAGHVEAVALLLNRGAFVDSRNCWRRTPLHLAARRGHTDVVKLLVQSGANLEAKRDGDETPLHFAIEGNHYETTKLLLHLGANPNVWGSKGTPLGMALSSGREMVDLFRTRYQLVEQDSAAFVNLEGQKTRSADGDSFASAPRRPCSKTWDIMLSSALKAAARVHDERAQQLLVKEGAQLLPCNGSLCSQISNTCSSDTCCNIKTQWF